MIDRRFDAGARGPCQELFHGTTTNEPTSSDGRQPTVFDQLVEGASANPAEELHGFPNAEQIRVAHMRPRDRRDPLPATDLLGSSLRKLTGVQKPAFLVFSGTNAHPVVARRHPCRTDLSTDVHDSLLPPYRYIESDLLAHPGAV
jgi:hypothetical protein